MILFSVFPIWAQEISNIQNNNYKIIIDNYINIDKIVKVFMSYLSYKNNEQSEKLLKQMQKTKELLFANMIYALPKMNNIIEENDLEQIKQNSNLFINLYYKEQQPISLLRELINLCRKTINEIMHIDIEDDKVKIPDNIDSEERKCEIELAQILINQKQLLRFINNIIEAPIFKH